jgi:uncharacterized protein YggL (DUF469 family)
MYRKNFWVAPVMDTAQKTRQLNEDIIPLISDDKEHEDVAGMIGYLKKGNFTFKVQDGFSIEYLFTMNNKENSDGTLLRFVHQVGNLSSKAYQGTVFINTDGRMCYRKTAKSPCAPHLHGLLTRFIANLNMKKMPDVEFTPVTI